MKTSQIFNVVLAVIILLLILAQFYWPSRRVASLTFPIQAKPDTVYVKTILRDTIRLVSKANRYLPRKVHVYQKPDTIRRKAIERDTLISGLRISGDQLELQSITPEGISLVSDYKLPEPGMSQITIDHKGNLAVIPDEQAIRKKRRKEKWRKIGNGCLVVGAFVLGVVSD